MNSFSCTARKGISLCATLKMLKLCDQHELRGLEVLFSYLACFPSAFSLNQQSFHDNGPQRHGNRRLPNGTRNTPTSCVCSALTDVKTISYRCQSVVSDCVCTHGGGVNQRSPLKRLRSGCSHDGGEGQSTFNQLIVHSRSKDPENFHSESLLCRLHV